MSRMVIVNGRPYVTHSPQQRIATGGMVLTGAPPLLVNRAQTRAFADRLNQQIQSLNNDIRNTLSYADPVDLDRQATDWETRATQMFWAPLAAQFRTLAASLRMQAAAIRARDVGKPVDQLGKERLYTTGWGIFLDNWNKFYASIQGFDPFGLSPADAWTEVENYESQFTRWRSQYESFGKKATAPLVTQTQVEEEHPGGGVFPAIGSTLNVPWTPILVTLGVLGAGYLLLNRQRSQQHQARE